MEEEIGRMARHAKHALDAKRAEEGRGGQLPPTSSNPTRTRCRMFATAPATRALSWEITEPCAPQQELHAHEPPPPGVGGGGDRVD